MDSSNAPASVTTSPSLSPTSSISKSGSPGHKFACYPLLSSPSVSTNTTPHAISPNVSSDQLTECTVLNPSKKLPDPRGKPIACLFVGSLNSSLTESQLTVSVENYFQKWGPLLHVKVLKDWLQRSYSFVQFANVEDASTALKEAQNTLLDGRRIRIERAKVNRSIYLAYPSDPSSFSTTDVYQLLKPYGLVEELVQTNDRSGFLVRFVYRDDAISAFMSLRNSHYKVVWAENVSAKSIFRKKYPNSSFNHVRPLKSSSSSNSVSLQKSHRNPPSQETSNPSTVSTNLPYYSNMPSLASPTPVSSSSLTTPNSATKSDNCSNMSTPNKSMSPPCTSPYSQSKYSSKSPSISKSTFSPPKYPSFIPSTHPYFQPVMPFVDPFSIFVDHLDSKNCTRGSLIELFSEYGKVLDCKFIRQSNKPAFAFLQFDSQQAAFNAVNNKPHPFFQKKPLRVKFRVLPPSTYPVSSYQVPMFSPSFLPSPRAMFPAANPANSSLTYPFHPSMTPVSPTAVGLQSVYPYYPYPEFCYAPGNLYYYGASSASHISGSE
ncbi:RNA-binding protein M [Schizosaccharomyces cryophilus OY26]|uniref:RNA-binding protein M n=1 Tax=Schizosaccharomyces cryophilus (strain OY26 / ATCC MYA-4695 / CBS 11777 / NBRC 106824 / NRRL Y48691) TaxID=653667 RepID=S9W1G7_SCHCR|nr:RNA-binding protein M [Schizosaccharomyces cryophilus OY26]EPY51830.1 RNA-binding protein M [Schizosaccharomyces cryophilus OY26]